MSAVWIPQPSRGSLSADFAKFFRKHVNAAEPDFEVEPVTESPDAVYEKEKKKGRITTREPETHAPSS